MNTEIRLKEDGAQAIEVSDNGTGIDPASYELLSTSSFLCFSFISLSAVKSHCTSKLSTFEDLEKITTLGFRGEVLLVIELGGLSPLLLRCTR
jgi:DNA mismatch repair protein PMS2